MFEKARQTFRNYPRSFWMMIVVNFIDQLGGSLLIPFFALYVTKKFNIGMTEVGVLFAVFGISSFLGAFPGGALTDRFGRKGIIIFGLLASSISRLFMGMASTYQLFVIVAFIAGIFSDVSKPVYESIFMDILPQEIRTSGFGIRRVAYNLAIVGGPVIGGFVATHSYLTLFIMSTVASGLAALIVFLFIAETKPAPLKGEKEESTTEIFAGYLRVLRDVRFMAFVGTSLFAWMIYVNMSTTLGVYLRNQHGVPESGYGWLLSLNAIMVVLFQFSVTQWTGKRPLLPMMALGTMFLAIGLGMYAFVASYTLFAIAMAILTIGELIAFPISAALVASFAPQNMRGRYNFIFYDSWVIAYAIGPYLAGLILDNLDPSLLWYACAGLGLVTTLIFLWLHLWIHPRTVPTVQKA